MSRISRRTLIGSGAVAAPLIGLSAASAVAARPEPAAKSTFPEVLKNAQAQQTRLQAKERTFLEGLGLAAGAEFNAPWEMIVEKLRGYVAGNDPKSVQVVTDPRAADWNDPTFGAWRLSRFADAMPKWGGSYETQSSFGEMYGIFISNIQLKAPDPALVKKADVARAEWTLALNAVQQGKATTGKRWDLFKVSQASLPPARQLTFDKWYNEFERPYLGVLQQGLDQRSLAYVAILNQAGGGYAQVASLIAAYSKESATFQTRADVPNTEIYERVYRYVVGSDLTAFVNAAKASSGHAIDWTFNQSSLRYNASSSHWGGSASYGFFVRGGASGGGSHVDWRTDSFFMRIKAKGLQRFDLAPGDWYSGNLIKLFGDGPFVPDGPIDIRHRSNTLWGPNGVFPLRTAGLVVAYEPSIEISMSQAEYARNASYWNAGGGFGFGPFSFGGSAGGSSVSIRFDEASNRVSITDTTGIPKVLAVVADVLPNFD